MAYKVIILYQLYMPSYFLGTFTEYPYLNWRTYVFLTGFYYQNRRSANFYRGLADSQKIGRIAFLIYPYSVV